MPLYEFECETCGAGFEELVRSASLVGEVTCPDCGSPQVHKKISRFAARIAGGSSISFTSSASSCAAGST